MGDVWIFHFGLFNDFVQFRIVFQLDELLNQPFFNYDFPSVGKQVINELCCKEYRTFLIDSAYDSYFSNEIGLIVI